MTTDLLDDLALPTLSDRRLAIRVTPDAVRRLRGGHPWLYDGSIESVNHEGSPGDLGVVFDRDRKFVAIGLWDPESPIRLKVLHAGSPATIDAAWFSARIVEADGRRSSLWRGSSPDRIGYRMVNGENDGLPGLVVDRYADVAVVKLYSAAWFAHLGAIVGGVRDAIDPRSIVLRLARSVAADPLSERVGAHDGDVLVGDLVEEPVRFDENGLTFEADVRAGQKTGHFLDQRANRRIVRDLASGRRVLDVFTSTGGFTVHAAAGGAESVHAIDLSAPTLDAARRNVDHNASNPAVAGCAVTFEVADAFEAMAELVSRRRRFDMVIVDPPSFAMRADERMRALRAYQRLTHLGLSLVEAGGVLVQASCSSRVTAGDFYDTVTRVAADRELSLVELRRTGHDVDHPVTFPEGAYLKAGVWRVDGRQ